MWRNERKSVKNLNESFVYGIVPKIEQKEKIVGLITELMTMFIIYVI